MSSSSPTCLTPPPTCLSHFFTLFLSSSFFFFKSFDGGSKQMLNGTMVHDVFQRAATAKDFSLETLQRLGDQALCSPRYLADM